MSTPLPSAEYRPPNLLPWAISVVLAEILVLCIAVWLNGCRSTAPPPAIITPAELRATAEVVFTGPCPESWEGEGLTCTAWDAPNGARYVSVHGPDGEPVLILVRGEAGIFQVAWEAGDG